MSLLLIQCYLYLFTFKRFSNKNNHHHFHRAFLLCGFFFLEAFPSIRIYERKGWFVLIIYIVYTFMCSHSCWFLRLIEVRAVLLHFFSFSVECWEFDSMTKFKMQIARQVASWLSLQLRSTSISLSVSGQSRAWRAETGAQASAHGAAALSAGARVSADSPAGSPGSSGEPAPPGKDRAGRDNSGSRRRDPGAHGRMSVELRIFAHPQKCQERKNKPERCLMGRKLAYVGCFLFGIRKLDQLGNIWAFLRILKSPSFIYAFPSF